MLSADTRAGAGNKYRFLLFVLNILSVRGAKRADERDDDQGKTRNDFLQHWPIPYSLLLVRVCTA
jgi:hypothetical protein